MLAFLHTHCRTDYGSPKVEPVLICQLVLLKRCGPFSTGCSDNGSRTLNEMNLWDMLHFHCIRFNTNKFKRLDFDVEDTDSYVLTPFEYVHVKTSSMRETCSLHVSAIMLHSLNLLTVICLAVIIKGYESRYWLFSPADPTSQ